MMWWGNGFGWGWMVFGGLMMWLFWAAVIVLVILAIRAFSGGRPLTGPSAQPPQTALDILKERYARGEITKDEYESMRRNLAT